MNMRKYKSIIFFPILLLFAFSCEWPFTTTPNYESVSGLEINHNIIRLMPSAEINLSWNEITVENFKMLKIERKRTQDTVWTDIVELSDAFQLSYIDTIFDDENLIYRIGIIDLEDNVLWVTESISIPKTKSVYVPNEFQTIQPAFDNELMDDGDTIIVNPGIYQETLEISGKDVLITSTEGYKSTTLMPTYYEDLNKKQRVLNISSGKVDGFTIEDGASNDDGFGGGVSVSQNGTVQNCYITGNVSTVMGGGIFLTNEGNLYNNIISQNVSFAGGNGIFILSNHGEIINNTIAGDDIVINGDCSGLTIRNNIIYNSFPDIDVSFPIPADTTGIIIDYLLLDSDIGIGTDNIIADPRFDNFIDFKLSPNSPCINAGHPGNQYFDEDGSRNDIGAYGGPSARL